MCKKYTSRSGEKLWKPSAKWIQAALARDDNDGFCLACKHDQGGCEPDMRRGECEACGELKVYGAEELLLCGIFHGEMAD